MKKILIVVVLLVLALVGYKILLPKNVAMDTDMVTSSTTNTSTDSDLSFISFDDFEDIPPSYVDSDLSSKSSAAADLTLNSKPVPPVVTTPSFTCDGRQHCAQMTSCAEATYFIQHCPNTKMDGNNDGIPCEQQWCK